MLEPKLTDIDLLKTVDPAFKEKLVDIMVKAWEKHSVADTTKYVLKRDSPAYESFKTQYR